MNINEFNFLIVQNLDNNRDKYIAEINKESESFYHSYTGLNYKDTYIEKEDLIELFAALEVLKTIRDDIPELTIRIESKPYKANNSSVKEYYRNIKHNRFLKIETDINKLWKKSFINSLKNKEYEQLIQYPTIENFSKDYISYYIFNNIIYCKDRLEEDKKFFTFIEKEIIKQFGINTDINNIRLSFKDYMWNISSIDIKKNLAQLTHKKNVPHIISIFSSLVHPQNQEFLF